MKNLLLRTAAILCLFLGVIFAFYVRGMYRRDQRTYEAIRGKYSRQQLPEPDGRDLLLPETGSGEDEQTFASESEIEQPSDAASAALRLPEIPAVDLEGLKKRNEDVTAWVEVPAAGISYPVMHNEEQSYYLHRDVFGRYAWAGSVFMASENSTALSDPHVILYAHNMRDGTMFAGLKKLEDPGKLEECPYIILVCPRKTLYYRILSVRAVPVASEAYRLDFADGEDFDSWCVSMLTEEGEEREKDQAGEKKEEGREQKNRKSIITEKISREPEKTVTVKQEAQVLKARKRQTEEQVITLSTCTEDPNFRLIVQGLLEYEIKE